MSADRDDTGSEEGNKERLIKLRDTGDDDNEMVAVREEEKEEKMGKEHHTL